MTKPATAAKEAYYRAIRDAAITLTADTITMLEAGIAGAAVDASLQDVAAWERRQVGPEYAELADPHPRQQWVPSEEARALADMHVKHAGDRLREAVAMLRYMSAESRETVEACLFRYKQGWPNPLGPITRSAEDHHERLLAALLDQVRRRTA